MYFCRLYISTKYFGIYWLFTSNVYIFIFVVSAVHPSCQFQPHLSRERFCAPFANSIQEPLASNSLMSSVCCLASRRKKDFSSVAIKTYADTDRIIDSILLKMSRKIEVKKSFRCSVVLWKWKSTSYIYLTKGGTRLYTINFDFKNIPTLFPSTTYFWAIRISKNLIFAFKAI